MIISDHKSQKCRREGESGNVLFLILIAVALFAALSYAVTQSTRSSGNSQGEVELISSAQITQFPAGIRTSIVRMVISGIDGSELLFNVSSDFGNLSGYAEEQRAVFHPRGGGATYQRAPNDIIVESDAEDGEWHFNSNFEIAQIGLSGSGGAELIAFLPGLSVGVCRRINRELGIGGAAGTPPVYSGLSESVYEQTIALGALTQATTQTTFQDTASETFPPDLNGRPFGCFQNTTDDEYVYYHVLLER